ncbi:GDSL-type esterase/lipase family protein [Phytohabitans sp. ZYX-F-186]|uniref:GDSL-type esterase/lipase family protein n=1 Tax=Phytohabitans maris TaxID=3071409 RepID=A0ABU0ZGF4_9ACTN|nr:GDSL-type esterase/lipase family protein [Phytohabitans sp. ZYX-F-186]MDQ7906138.1 GDSL-type esterase/lipase family protein [Phytohabitans sp. ZYX-F-186]
MSLPRRTLPRLRPLPLLAATVAATLAATLVAAAPAAAADPYPSSMASTGDSITRGFNACGFYVDCPSRSFSTGTETGVNSHYRRVLAANPAVSGRNFNDAESGATAADLPGQIDLAVGQGVDYVTVLIGANDACAGSEAGMTPVATYRGHIDTALARLKAGRPGARVFVMSIPDLKRLWEVGKGNFLARSAWSLLGICQSMLANPTSTAAADVARRDRVRQRVADYNAQLAAACAAYGSLCRYDGGAIFNYPFTLSQVSGWDYFHPDTDGQTVLAATTWAAGFAWTPAPV